MDLHSTLPDFPTKSYTHILPSLEKHKITVKELLLFDALEIAKRAQVPVTDVRNLTSHVIEALHGDLGIGGQRDTNQRTTKAEGEPDAKISGNGEVPKATGLPRLSYISTLDPTLDASLGGGISTGYVTELAGESGSGKTQFLLHLLLSVQLPPPHGLSRKALYVSTEADLPTGRLSQLLAEHPRLSSLASDSTRPSLENILSITTIDLETQDHILNYQIPVAVSRYNVGLVVIDSITANYRAESSSENVSGLLERAWQLKQLGHFLRNLAVKENIAVVVANQVSDRFHDTDDPLWADNLDNVPSSYVEDNAPQSSPLPGSSQVPHSTPVPAALPAIEVTHSSPLVPGLSSSPPVVSSMPNPEDIPTQSARVINVPSLNTLLSLEHQEPFFTGWGEPPLSAFEVRSSHFSSTFKTPALGLVWTNQIACRLVLKIDDVLVGHTPVINENPAPNAHTAPSERPAVDIAPAGPKDSTLETRDVVEQAVLEIPSTQDTEELISDDDEEYAGESFVEDFYDAPPAAEDNNNNNRGQSPPASPERRKVRMLQVVFSPWTSGEPSRALTDDATANGSDGYVTDYDTDEEDAVEFDPMIGRVEFEILPSGIRGVTRS
ncbi:hypothetical protein AJ80_08442 [Polytolypa hystricis UAMH7299]|uniref:RecA family profile 1 domain-containing protein n=1 Tax=Polytolypa hystricis (strain UAMH7299) TaxID=1447883 RepID=A0A2B7X7Y5_POLH7|nr:hypothetical protein AJ80_08442 [Polytolypa hystricis UAMH7299]